MVIDLSRKSTKNSACMYQLYVHWMAADFNAA